MSRGPLPALACFVSIALIALPDAQSVGPAPSTEAVNAAIERGVDFLLRSQNRDGSWGVDLNERGLSWHDLRDGSGALAVYTLMKCGLSPDHPALQRATAFLLESTPRHTYSAGIQLHTLVAFGNPEHRKRMRDLLEVLDDLKQRDGWDYPGIGRADLSNTQIAALGFRAAESAGMEVPRGTWAALVGMALRYQERPQEVPGAEELAKEQRTMAGFCYTPGEAPSASMTTAGLTILGIATEKPGRVGRKIERQIEEARRLAFNWLGRHYAVAGNPGGAASWHYYYLYGLERVCALSGLDELAGQDWYAQGAAQLIKEQRDDGGWRVDGRSIWPPTPLPVANTCFALLFLRKATLSPSADRREHFRSMEESDSPVWVRVDAKETWTVWLSGFSQEALARFESVESVEWWIDGVLLERLVGAAAQPWGGERFAIRHQPSHGGDFVLECRVSARSSTGESLRLSSLPLRITHELLLEPWMLGYARDAARNLLAQAEVTLSASSQESGFHPIGDVLDGLQGSSWWAAEDDLEPWIRLECERGVRIAELWISPAAANEVGREVCLAPRRGELRINGAKTPLLIDFEADSRLKTRVVLPRRTLVRSLELRLVGHGSEPGKCVGLAELEGR